MKKVRSNDFNAALCSLDEALLFEHMAREEKLVKKKQRAKVFTRIVSAAACICVVVAGIAALYNGTKKNMDPFSDGQIGVNLSDVDLYEGTNVIGVQNGPMVIDFINDDFRVDAESMAAACMVAPDFVGNIVLEVELLGVLADTYRDPEDKTEYNIARLRVIDDFGNENVPEEIFFRYTYYDKDILESYDSFIISLMQIGCENYMMIGNYGKEMTYFKNMTQLYYVSDLGYGGVIAFNGDKVDGEFWRMTDHYLEGGLESHFGYDFLDDYPAREGMSIETVKTNVNECILKNKDSYITADLLFASDAAAPLREYFSEEGSVFSQVTEYNQDGIISLTYTRLINGYLTDEIWTFTPDTDGTWSVTEPKVKYTKEDIAQITDLGELLSGMNPEVYEPLNLQITDAHTFVRNLIEGHYRKIDGETVAIVWSSAAYHYCNTESGEHGHMFDTRYDLFYPDGSTRSLDAEELKFLIGDDRELISNTYNGLLLYTSYLSCCGTSVSWSTQMYDK